MCGYKREQILNFLKNGGERVLLQVKNSFMCVRVLMVINLLVADVIEGWSWCSSFRGKF